MTGIESYGVALPTLRLPASAYVEAWGSCAARGLKQKAFCAYDEDPVTLGIGAARQALLRLPTSVEIGALFFGVCLRAAQDYWQALIYCTITVH